MAPRWCIDYRTVARLPGSALGIEPGVPGQQRQGAIYPLSFGYPVYMTKRLIDVDDEKLEAVRTLLGTGTLKATVNTALEEVLALDRRRRALLAKRGVDPTDLADPDARRAAWG